MINNTAFNSMKLKIINRQILKMLDSGGGALQAIVYIKNNTTLIKNVLLRKRWGNIIFFANGGSKKNIYHVFSEL